MSDDNANPNPTPEPEPTNPASPTDPSPTPGSPSDNPPPAEQPAAAVEQPKPADDPDQAARAAARAVKPETADGYSLDLSDKARGLLGDLKDDPAIAALRKAAVEKGWTQGDFEDRVVGAIEVLADAGVIEPRLDFGAQKAELGDNAEARMQEVSAFAAALKERGEIDEQEFAELDSLAFTAAGTRLIEKMRKWMVPGGAGDIKLPDNPGDVDPKASAQEEARAMVKDPRYATDNKFKRQADKKWMEAFGG